MRPSWEEYFLSMTSFVAERSTCPRLKVGAILVQDNRIISTGYNGARSKERECLESGCLLKGESCVRGIHAEMNMLHGLQGQLKGKELKVFISHTPCPSCLNALLLGLEGNELYLYWREKYKQDDHMIREICGRHFVFQDQDSMIYSNQLRFT